MDKDDILILLGYALDAMEKEEDAHVASADRDLGHAHGIRDARGILMRVIDQINEDKQ